MNILEKFTLEGKTAVVTGGGTGLGKAICHAFAKAGADIAVAGRRIEPIRETAGEVKQFGKRAIAVSADITDTQQVDALMEKTVQAFGKVDILVNNAGIARGIEPSPWDENPVAPQSISELTQDKWQQALDINLGGTFYCCRSAAKYMLPRRSGKVINLSSVGGMRATKGWITYPSAKGGVIMLTKALAVSWADDNIQVNCIAPGFIEIVSASQTFKERKPAFIPMGRFGSPEEVGLLAVFLASEASDYITGECFTIEGAGTVGYAPTGYAPAFEM
jgi:NAD(P)-dependent dehydrogenase (short-subunit alcohol dehydrogenase family)